MTLSQAQPDRLEFERELYRRGFRRVAGVDEVGRGPLAGPVVTAAVILPVQWVAGGMPEDLRSLNDSKQLSARQRENFFAQLTSEPGIEYAVTAIEPPDIDRWNILQATHRAMVLAVAGLPSPPDHVLVDGLPVPSLGEHQTALVKGDARSYSIAAASVIAKVTRDRRMVAHDQEFPGYGFAQHKGYPTAAHRECLQRLGPCPIHRRSYLPVRVAQRELF
jgi:ribonuclease HII